MQRPTLRCFLISFALCALLCAFALSRLFLGVPFLKALIQFALFAASAYVGREIFLNALVCIRRKRFGEELFAVVAVVFCAGFSLYEMFMMIFTDRGAERLLFAPCAAIISVSLMSEYMTEKTKPASSALSLLESLKADTAVVLRGGVEARVSADEIFAGDIFAIRPGETVPCDGEIIAGRSELDEKILTGALLPALKGEGEHVMAGSVNLSGFLTVRADGENELDALIAAYRGATRPELKCLAQKAIRLSGLLAVSVAVTAMILSALLGGGDLSIFLPASVMAVFCPCGLMLTRAIPDLAAARRGSSDGLDIRNPSVLENIVRADTVVIDKTGTATVGKLAVSGVITLGELNETAVIRIAAALSADVSGADFFAIAEHCRLLDTAVPPCIALERLPAKLTGIVDGKRAELSALWEDILPIIGEYPELSDGDMAIRVVFSADEAVGIIALSDRIKPNAITAAKALSERGIGVMLVSGEDDPLISDEADDLCASDFAADLSAVQKSEYIQKLRNSGRTVVMIGDGVSDCAALKSADFSFALGSGAIEAKESSSAVLLRNDLRDVIAAIELSNTAQKTEKLSVCAMSALRLAALASAAALYIFEGARFGVMAATAGILLSAVLPYVFSTIVRRGR